MEMDYENRMVSADYLPEDEGGQSLRPPDGIYRPDQGQGKPLRLYQCGQAAGRGAGSCAAVRASRLGKTTLAGIIANEMGVNLRITAGPALERAGDLAALLTNLDPGDVLFIDEIHRLPRTVEEILYPAMEDFAIDIINGKGQGAASIHLPLPRFTLSVPPPGRGSCCAVAGPIRCGDAPRAVHSGRTGADRIRSARILGIPCEPDGALEIASRSRGTPRIANRLLKRVRDFAQVISDGVITCDAAREALDRLEVDELGLDMVDRRMLEAMIRHYNGGPVGLDTLAAVIGEGSSHHRGRYEPYLMQIGF